MKKKNNKSLYIAIIKLIFICIALLFSISIYITLAWYSQNEEVEGSSFTVNSDSSPTSLFISNNNTKDWNISCFTDFSSISNSLLYPISTRDCQNWYYVSGWGRGYYDENNGWTIEGPGALKAVATTYKKANIITNSSYSYAGTYVNDAEGNQTKTAFLYNKYVLYTNKNNLDIYLNPDGPITLSGNSQYQLDKALRIAIKVGNILIIYAPYSEDDEYVGNSYGCLADENFYAVQGTDTTSTQVSVLNSVITSFVAGEGYTAQLVNSEYEAGNATRLGSCGASSDLIVETYIWLEGTDCEVYIGKSDNDLGNLTVNFSFIGIENN